MLASGHAVDTERVSSPSKAILKRFHASASRHTENTQRVEYRVRAKFAGCASVNLRRKLKGLSIHASNTRVVNAEKIQRKLRRKH